MGSLDQTKTIAVQEGGATHKESHRTKVPRPAAAENDFWS